MSIPIVGMLKVGLRFPTSNVLDLLAVEVTPDAKIRRYHIESGISVSGTFSKLTAKPFSPEKLKERIHQAGQRRTIGYFIDRKFGSPEVLAELARFGFKEGNYTKIIVTWGWEEEAKVEAERNDVVLWDFRQILREIAQTCRVSKKYFGDDTLKDQRALNSRDTISIRPTTNQVLCPQNTGRDFWQMKYLLIMVLLSTS